MHFFNAKRLLLYKYYHIVNKALTNSIKAIAYIDQNVNALK